MLIKKIIPMVSVISFSLLAINSAASGDNLKTKATITNLKNKVELKYGSSVWRPASLNQLVRPDTQIRTGPLSKAELLYSDGTITKIGSRTSLTVLNRESREIRLIAGNLWFKVTKKSYGLKIFAPRAVAAITGTEGGVKVEEVEKGKSSDSNSNSKIDVSVSQETINLTNPKKENEENNTKESIVTVAVTEGTVDTTVGERTFAMNAGEKVSFPITKPEDAEVEKVGIEKIKSMFESSKASPSDTTKTASVSNSNYVTNGINMAKMVELKENMSLLQNMADTYALDEGSYPSDVNVLIEDAKKKGYFKSFKNPFNFKKDINNTIMNYSSFKPSRGAGIILYEASECSGKSCSTYKIYSSSLDGKLLQVGGRVHFLSNR